jgi:5-hydroxyisourate hydrolase-like protein (transthyretin family)
MWNAIGTTTTNDTGGLTFVVQGASAGTFTYVVSFLGDQLHAPCTNTTGPLYVLTPTNITATATTPPPYIGQNVTISGRLTANGTGLANQPVKLYKWSPTMWNAIGTTTTNDAGGFALNVSESAVGTGASSGVFTYRAVYAATGVYAGALSGSVAVRFSLNPTSVTAIRPSSTLYIGNKTTISGTLTGNAGGLAHKQIKLYRLGVDPAQSFVGAATTTDNGSFTFTFTENSTIIQQYHPQMQGVVWRALQYQVAFLGDNAYLPSQSSTTLVYYLLPTDLTASMSPQLPYVGQNVTFSGSLTGNGATFSGQPIQLFTVAGSGSYVEVANTTTALNGTYAINFTENASGTYSAEVTYPGNVPKPNSGDPNYLPSDLQFLVTFVPQPTAIKAQATPNEQTVGKNVTISGTLIGASNGAGISAKPLRLYRYDGTTWISNQTTTTDSSGNFTFNASENATGTFFYVVGYPGDAAFAAADSTAMTITADPF